MSNIHVQRISQSCFLIAVRFVFLLLAFTLFCQAESEEKLTKNVVLQGAIQLEPLNPHPHDEKGEIQPGSPVKIMVTLKNKGNHPSSSGEIYVRYGFAHPLDKHSESVIFRTENKAIPSIEPGKQVVITFDTPHQIASLIDFVRNDWLLREYQAIVIMGGQEYVIGTAALTFSAYYYPGMVKEIPNNIDPMKK